MCEVLVAPSQKEYCRNRCSKKGNERACKTLSYRDFEKIGTAYYRKEKKKRDLILAYQIMNSLEEGEIRNFFSSCLITQEGGDNQCN